MDETRIEETIGRNPAMRYAIVHAAAIFAIDYRTTVEYMIFGPENLDDLDDDSDVMIFTLDARKGGLDELLDLLQSLRPEIADRYRIRKYRRRTEFN